MRIKIPILSARKERRIAKKMRDMLTIKNADEAVSMIRGIRLEALIARRVFKDSIKEVDEKHDRLNGNAYTQYVTHLRALQTVNERLNTLKDVHNANMDCISDDVNDLTENVKHIRASHGKTLWKLNKGVGNLFKKVNPMAETVAIQEETIKSLCGVCDTLTARLLELERTSTFADKFVGQQRHTNENMLHSMEVTKNDIQKLYDSIKCEKDLVTDDFRVVTERLYELERRCNESGCVPD